MLEVNEFMELTEKIVKDDMLENTLGTYRGEEEEDEEYEEERKAYEDDGPPTGRLEIFGYELIIYESETQPQLTAILISPYVDRKMHKTSRLRIGYTKKVIGIVRNANGLYNLMY